MLLRLLGSVVVRVHVVDPNIPPVYRPDGKSLLARLLNAQTTVQSAQRRRCNIININ